MIKQTELVINASKKSFEENKINDEAIIGPVDYGFKQFKKHKKNYISFGKGVLAGSNIPGTRRLIFTAHSPLWDHFYISTMGGAAYIFNGLGINYVSITDACDTPSILEIRKEKEKTLVKFYPVDIDSVWKGYKNETGLYALQQYIYDTYGKDFNTCRILVTGPASQQTMMGAIASAPIENGKISPADCWAGRGGLGSKLFQDHKIAAIIYGGDYQEPPTSPLKHYDEINKIFEKKYNKKMILEDMDATIKYKYDPAFHSGGTLGVNFTRIRGWMFSFNYQSVNFPEEDRKEIHKKYIIDHYLKQFNEETIEKKQYKHCGEPCGAVCKKMNGIYKKDYEPYEALGPNSGIFDQREAEKINHYADAMGFDAIQIGSMISWIMECIDKKLFPKEDFDITMTPKWDYKNFDILNDSKNNADLGCQLIDRIINHPKFELFRKGMRYAAKELDKKYNINTRNLAVYNSFGETGWMVPNQYWVPGMFSPMPIMGKYFEYYEADFLSPKDLGRKNVERMIKEFYSDNTGICRFHRAWVENIVGDIVNTLYNENIDYYIHHKKLVQLINLENKPVFWESERVVDIIWQYIEKIAKFEPENPERDEKTPRTPDSSIHYWVDRFRKDKWSAAKEYWENINQGINEGFR